jgi:AraC-like DNA-binding protein
MVAEDVLAEVLTSSAPQGAVTTRCDLRAPWGIRFPASPRAGFHVVISGTCWLRLGDGEPVELRTGDVALLPHGGGHVLSSSPRGSAIPLATLLARPTTVQQPGLVQAGGDGAISSLICGIYHFAAEERHPVLGQLPPLLQVPGTRQAGAGIASITDLLVAELERADEGASAVSARLADVLFVLVVRQWIQAQPEGVGGWLGALRDPRIGRVLTRVHREPERRWTVDDLAESAAMSAAAFKRRFTALVGEPPLTYVTRSRMDVAARLLRRSNAPLAQVAAAVGYESEYAFGRAFKRALGVAPGRFRAGGRRNAEV